jgi:hypothetical protein
VSSGDRTLVVVLESRRQSSRLTVVAVDDAGSRVVAAHDRCPGGLRAIRTDGRDVFVALATRGGIDWRRFAPPLSGPSTKGPDDDDGLRRLEVAADERFVAECTTPTDLATFMRERGCTWLDEQGVVRSSAGELWRSLANEPPAVRSLTSLGDSLVLLVEGDRSLSPFPEDALPHRELVRASADVYEVQPLPLDAVAASLSADGTFLVLRASRGADPRIEMGTATAASTR